jgi:poly(hydroxyalkanoate) granule-associated protein
MKKKTNGKSVTPMLKESAQSVWLAGLGALAMAGEGGHKLFNELVKKGDHLDKANRARLVKIKGKALDLRGGARAAVVRITAPFDAGVTGALHRLGVPTRKEILSLTKRVEELTRAVERSRRKGGARKVAAPKAETA